MSSNKQENGIDETSGRFGLKQRKTKRELKLGYIGRDTRGRQKYDKCLIFKSITVKDTLPRRISIFKDGGIF